MSTHTFYLSSRISRLLMEKMKAKISLTSAATAGIGKATAVALAKLRATVIIIGRNEEKGAETSVYLASSPEAAGVTGKFFVNKKLKKKVQPRLMTRFFRFDFGI